MQTKTKISPEQQETQSRHSEIAERLDALARGRNDAMAGREKANPYQDAADDSFPNHRHCCFLAYNEGYVAQQRRQQPERDRREYYATCPGCHRHPCTTNDVEEGRARYPHYTWALVEEYYQEHRERPRLHACVCENPGQTTLF